MDDINFRIDGHITQNNLNGDNKIEFTGEIIKDENKKAEEVSDKKRCVWIRNQIKGKWFLWGIVIILLGGILFSQIEYFRIMDNHVGLVLGFVGVLATFIVVSNYAQIKHVQDELNKVQDKTNKVKDELNKFQDALTIIHNESKALKNDIKAEVMGDVFSLEAGKYHREKDIVNAFNYYTYALFFLGHASEENINIKTVDALAYKINTIIEQTDPRSIVDDNKFIIGIFVNHSCVKLLKRSNIEIDMKNKIIGFIQEINEIAIKNNKADYGDDYGNFQYNKKQ